LLLLKKNEHGHSLGPKGPKGKVPWITLNGQDLADSQLCIEFLAKKYDKDFTAKSFAPKEQGLARAFLKMAEESLFW
jgi:hypothetical protein